MPNPRGNPNFGKYGNKFTSENQPLNKPGPKPSKFKQFITENDLSGRDIAAGILYLSDLDEDELDAVIADKKRPVLLRAFAKALKAELDKSGLFNIETLLNRALGKPAQLIKTDDEENEKSPIRIEVDHNIKISETDTVVVNEPRTDNQAH
jgi:hypothetical protein